MAPNQEALTQDIRDLEENVDEKSDGKAISEHESDTFVMTEELARIAKEELGEDENVILS